MGFFRSGNTIAAPTAKGDFGRRNREQVGAAARWAHFVEVGVNIEYRSALVAHQMMVRVERSVESERTGGQIELGQLSNPNQIVERLVDGFERNRGSIFDDGGVQSVGGRVGAVQMIERCENVTALGRNAQTFCPKRFAKFIDRLYRSEPINNVCR